MAPAVASAPGAASDEECALAPAAGCDGYEPLTGPRGRSWRGWARVGLLAAACTAAAAAAAATAAALLQRRGRPALAPVAEEQSLLWQQECSPIGHDCWKSKCCQDGGLKCFAKDMGWAECRASCTPGMIRWDEPKEFRTKWFCAHVRRGLGPAHPSPAPPGPCSQAGAECTHTKCCGSDPALKCFHKNHTYAECRRDCAAGVHPEDPLSSRQPWSCKLAERKSVVVPLPQPSRSGAPTLFCIALMLPFGNELALVRSQLRRGAGIFRCDAYGVYSDRDVELSAGPPVRIGTSIIPGPLNCTIGGVYHTALNTEIFLRVWRKVFEDGRYRKFEWTVKVDPDAVFLPHRLRQHASRYLYLTSSTADAPVFLNNCKDGLHGPIEPVSRGAMEVFKKGIDHCQRVLKKEFSQYGEDVFVRHCLKELDVQKGDDFGLLTETHCDPFPQHPMPCVSGKVAFHPLKKPDEYFECLEQAQQHGEA